MVLGVLGIAFGIAFLLLFRNSPDTDPRTNQAERDLINLDPRPAAEDAASILPWRRVLKSPVMYFFVLQQITSAGADGIYGSFMGDYFLNAKGIEMVKAGLLVSLPLWGGAIGGMVGGYCNDWMIQRTGSRRWGRSTVGFLGKFLACILMLVTIQQESAVAAGLSLFVVKFFTDWSQPTVWGTCTDLGGRYSATVFGIINTTGSIGGILSPVMFGMILDYNTSEQVIDGVTQSVTNYNPLFLAVAGMYLISALTWLFIDCTKSLEHDAEWQHS